MTSKQQGAKPTPKTPTPVNPVLDLTALADSVETSVTKKVMGGLRSAIKDMPKGLTSDEVRAIADKAINEADEDIAKALAEVQTTVSKVDADTVEAFATVQQQAEEMKTLVSSLPTGEDFEAFKASMAKKLGLPKAEIEKMIEAATKSGEFRAAVGQSVCDELLDEDESSESENKKRLDEKLVKVQRRARKDAVKEMRAEIVDAKGSMLEFASEALSSKEVEILKEIEQLNRNRFALYKIDEPGVGFGAFAREFGLMTRNVYLHPVGSVPRVLITFGIAFGGVTLLSATLLANQAWAQHWAFKWGVPALVTVVNEFIAWRVRAVYFVELDENGVLQDFEPTGPAIRSAERKANKAGRKANKAEKKAAKKAAAAAAAEA